MTEMSSEQQVQQPPENYTLQVDFAWRKYKVLITEKTDTSKPLYIADCHNFRKPHLVFKRQDGSTFGTGSLQVIGINADCELDGNPMLIKALKRWTTKYEHISHTLKNEDGSPVRLTWSSSSGWKNWDFICSDEQGHAVAKFSGHIWAVKKFADIEFPTPTVDDALREEIVVAGTTLYNEMILRVNNIGNLVGAVFARPGHIKDGKLATSHTVPKDDMSEHSVEQVNIPMNNIEKEAIR